MSGGHFKGTPRRLGIGKQIVHTSTVSSEMRRDLVLSSLEARQRMSKDPPFIDLTVDEDERREFKSTQDQMASYRRKMASKRHFDNIGQVHTLSTTRQKETMGRKFVATASSLPRTNERSKVHRVNDQDDPESIGRKALEHTNEFRAENGLEKVLWSPEITKICMSHSVAMGRGKVPLGHSGFGDRIRQIPWPHSMGCENVAMNAGSSDVAKVSVNGWINSPGHRRNLLTRGVTRCGIGVFQNSSGVWYLTQIFSDG